MNNKQQDSDQEQKVTRRTFLQYSSMVATATLAVSAIALKTDALGKFESQFFGPGDEPLPYQYVN